MTYHINIVIISLCITRSCHMKLRYILIFFLASPDRFDRFRATAFCMDICSWDCMAQRFCSASKNVEFDHGWYHSWLVVSTPLKNMSQLGLWHSQYMETYLTKNWLVYVSQYLKSQYMGKKTHVPNHQPDRDCIGLNHEKLGHSLTWLVWTYLKKSTDGGII